MDKRAFFLLGVGIGSLVTWWFVKSKYEKIAQEEIEAVIEHFSQKEKELEDAAAIDIPEEVKVQSTNQGTKYNHSVTIEKPALNEYIKKADTYKSKDIRVISPDEYGDIDDYERCSLTYYADGFLVDENDELVDDIEETVGEDFADHFGEYEEDSVYIRNDIRECDYEVLMSLQKYREVIKAKPKPVEVE